MQGELYVTPVLTNSGGTGGDDDVVTYTIQYNAGAGVGWEPATDANNSDAKVLNVQLQVGADATVSNKHVFDGDTYPGQYRVLTTNITGGMCSLGENGTSMRVNFGDNNNSNCTGSTA